MSNGPEKRVENKIKNALTDRNIYFNKNFGGAFAPVGQPDISGVLAPTGRFFAIEVKRKGSEGKPSGAQLRHLQAIAKSGGYAFISASSEVVPYMMALANHRKSDVKVQKVELGEITPDSVKVWAKRTCDVMQIVA